MTVTNTDTRLSAGPGRYYLGDPFYAINSYKWREFLDARDEEGVTRLDRTRAIAFSTHMGDGCHEG